MKSRVRLVFGPDDHEEYSAARNASGLWWSIGRALVARPWTRAGRRRTGPPQQRGRAARALDARPRRAEPRRVVPALRRPARRRARHRARRPARARRVSRRAGLARRGVGAAEELHAQIVESTPALHEALSDERNRSLGTFWAIQLRRHGIPAADSAAVARFLDRVPGGEVDVDREALAEVTQREAAAELVAEPATQARAGVAARRGAARRSRGQRRRWLQAVTRWVRTARR